MSIYFISYCALSSTNIGFSRGHCPWYIFSNATLNMGFTFITSGSSNLAALYPIICSSSNSTTYYGRSFIHLAFSFRYFVHNSILSPSSMSNFLLALLDHCLLVFAYFVSNSWTSIYILCNSDGYSSTALMCNRACICTYFYLFEYMQ